MSQARKRGWKVDDEVRSFRSSKGFRRGHGTFADEQWWFECACTMIFPPENGADDHDVTM